MDVVRSAANIEVRVLSFVFLLQHEPTIKLSKAELEWSIWIPLHKLAKHRGFAKFSFGESPAYIVGKTVILGLTFRIVENFFRSFNQLQNDDEGYWWRFKFEKEMGNEPCLAQ
jgi:hypothetical protein